MKAVLLALLAGVLLVGCAPKEDAPAADAPQTKTETVNAPQSGDGVRPMTPTPTPIAPVAGGENLQGSSAGGVGQAAKDQARNAAAKAQGGSVPESTDQ